MCTETRMNQMQHVSARISLLIRSQRSSCNRSARPRSTAVMPGQGPELADGKLWLSRAGRACSWRSKSAVKQCISLPVCEDGVRLAELIVHQIHDIVDVLLPAILHAGTYTYNKLAAFHEF